MQNKIRYHRFTAGEMTQQELAVRTGVTRQTIIAVEKGEFNPSVKLALKMAAAFHVKVEELFMLDDKDN